jgi:hypothetical protein
MSNKKFQQNFTKISCLTWVVYEFKLWIDDNPLNVIDSLQNQD